LKYVELLVEEDKMKYLECLKLEEAGKQSSIARTHRSNQFKRTRYYWGAHQRFFNSLILSFKAPAVKDLRRYEKFACHERRLLMIKSNYFFHA